MSAFEQDADRTNVSRIRNVVIILALTAIMSAYALLLIPQERWRTNVHATKGADSAIKYLEYQKAYQRRGRARQDRTDLLITASYFGAVEDMKTLISEGAEVNGTNERLVTPLISAVSGCQLSAVEYLLSQGADRSMETDQGFNAFDFAFYLNDVAVAALVRTKAMAPKPMRDFTVKISKD